MNTNRVYTLSDLQIAKDFAEHNPGIKFSTNLDHFVEYQNNPEGETGYYKRINNKDIKPRILAHCQNNGIEIRSNHSLESVVKLFSALPEIRVEDEFDSPKNKYILNFRNCLIDISSGTPVIKEHSPNYLFTRQLQVNYDPEAKAINNIKTLNQILPNKEKQDYFLKLMMYLLIPSYEFQKIWIFYGNGGNGKDTILAPIQSILGHENVSTVSAHTFMESRFAESILEKMYLNVSSEHKVGQLSQEAFKKLSGETMMTADRKNREASRFSNYARLIMLVNQVPSFTEMNEAIKRRYVVMNFDQSFCGKQADTGLRSRLITESEKSGYINLLLEKLPGIMRLNSIGRSVYFEEPHCILTETQAAFGKMNNVNDFLQDECDLNINYETRATMIWEMYMEHSKKNSEGKLGRDTFYTILERDYKLHIHTGTGNNKYISGIRPKNGEPDNHFIRQLCFNV